MLGKLRRRLLIAYIVSIIIIISIYVSSKIEKKNSVSAVYSILLLLGQCWLDKYGRVQYSVCVSPVSIMYALPLFTELGFITFFRHLLYLNIF